MAGAVIVVEPRLPQRRAGDGVEMRPRHALRKAQGGEGEMPLQDAGGTRDELGRRIPRPRYPQGAGDVGGAVRIVRARSISTDSPGRMGRSVAGLAR